MFLVLVAGVISLYFRTWKMAVAALVALLHDVIITVGLYALIGLEVTPATVIGFLTILGYSLYDTVVVFDKVRENTDEAVETQAAPSPRPPTSPSTRPWSARSTPASSPCSRSAPSSSSGSLLGAGTLVDLSLALFIGIAFGTYSSVFIATPLLVQLREKEPAIVALEKKVLAKRAERAARPRPAAAGRAARSLVADGDGRRRTTTTSCTTAPRCASTSRPPGCSPSGRPAAGAERAAQRLRRTGTAAARGHRAAARA